MEFFEEFLLVEPIHLVMGPPVFIDEVTWWRWWYLFDGRLRDIVIGIVVVEANILAAVVLRCRISSRQSARRRCTGYGTRKSI